MRINNARDLGLVVRDARHGRGWSQTRLATEASVSRRWLSDLEGGKATAEFALILRTLDALELGLNAVSTRPGPGAIDLDAVLETMRSDV